MTGASVEQSVVPSAVPGAIPTPDATDLEEETATVTTTVATDGNAETAMKGAATDLEAKSAEADGEDAMEASAADVIGCVSSTVDSGFVFFDRRSPSNITKMPDIRTPSPLEAKGVPALQQAARGYARSHQLHKHSEEGERRMTQWDIKPAGYENITAEQAKLSGMFPLPGAPRAAPMDPSKLAAFISPSAGTATAAALATSGAKQSKRLYVHNLPQGCTSQEIMEFFNNQLNGLNVVSGNDPCLSAHIATSKEYAALEFKAAEDATLALAMNGISMRDDGGAPDRSGLSIRRPKDYITPTADENAYPPGDEVSSVVKDSPNKLSIVNIPTYIEEEQIRELVETMGKLKAFTLVKDTGTDQHRVGILVTH